MFLKISFHIGRIRAKHSGSDRIRIRIRNPAKNPLILINFARLTSRHVPDVQFFLVERATVLNGRTIFLILTVISKPFVFSSVGGRSKNKVFVSTTHTPLYRQHRTYSYFPYLWINRKNKNLCLIKFFLTTSTFLMDLIGLCLSLISR